MIQKEEFRQQLLFTIAPFYAKLRDTDYDGYYGRVDYDLCLYKKTSKNLVANSRILWFFSRLGEEFANNGYKSYADHAYSFLLSHGFDKKDGGIYWSLSYAGEVEDESKNTFCQAYGILALCAYAKAFKDSDALEKAKKLQEYVELNLKDSYGYKESLEENKKSLASLIHLLEAYTLLYETAPSAECKKPLEYVYNLVVEKVLSHNQIYLQYDGAMNPIELPYRSFGHEIEASYIVDNASRALGLEPLDLTVKLAEKTLRDGFVNNHLAYTSLDSRAVHWVQCEAIIGFVNAYNRTSEMKYLDASQAVWSYVKDNLVDNRLGGEWFYDDTRNPRDIVSPWKGPYNNGMLCLTLGV